MAEDDDPPAREGPAGEGGEGPVEEGVGGGVGHLGAVAGVGPGANIDVEEAAVLGDRAARRMGEDDAGLGAGVAAGEVDGGVGWKLGEEGDEAWLGEGPGVGGADEDLDALRAELAGEGVGLALAVNEEG